MRDIDVLHVAKGNYFYVDERIINRARKDKFYLHDHDWYEFLFLQDGDYEFTIEGNNYSLSPGDIIYARKNEMHQGFPHSGRSHRRIVLNVYPAFFDFHNCPQYEHQFFNVQPGIANQIKASAARSCGLSNTFGRLVDYLRTYSDEKEPVLAATIVEILYLVSQVKNVSPLKENTDNHVAQVISYINDHYTENIHLTTLEEKFFISRSYLCKIFQKATGYTIHDYIRHKRLIRVKELRQAGHNITDAAMLAGFNDYSSFYRAYKKLMSDSPKNNY